MSIKNVQDHQIHIPGEFNIQVEKLLFYGGNILGERNPEKSASCGLCFINKFALLPSFVHLLMASQTFSIFLSQHSQKRYIYSFRSASIFRWFSCESLKRKRVSHRHTHCDPYMQSEWKISSFPGNIAFDKNGKHSLFKETLLLSMRMENIQFSGKHCYWFKSFVRRWWMLMERCRQVKHYGDG